MGTPASSAARSRLAPRAGALACALALSWSVPAPAFAEAPVDLAGQRVVDHSGALGSSGTQEAAKATEGTGLYSVYVHSFDGMDPTQWCIRTAQRSKLDTRAVLLVIATGDRKFDLCAGSDVDLDSSQRNAIGQAARSELGNDNWAGATVAAAEELRAQTSGGSGSSGRDGSGDDTGGGFGLLGAGALGVAAIGGVGAYALMKRKRKATSGSPAGPAYTGAPARPLSVEEATQQIVRVDDQVRQAREDLDFASAELGEAKAAPFEKALREAEGHRDRAWELIRQAQQGADDTQRSALAQQAVAEANRAGELIAAQGEAFSQARQVQERAGDDLAGAERLIMDARRAEAAAREELERLHHDFPHTSFTSLDDNPDQATRLLASAEQMLTEGKAAWDTGDRQGAISQLTLAQRAVTQANNQIAQIMDARATLGDVNRALLREISALGNDLDDADRLAANSQAVRPLVAEARAAIEDANRARAGQGDPLAAMARMTEANAAIDEVLDPLRDAEASAAKAHAAVSGRIGQVERRVGETEAYISAHRGAVGAVARERANQARQLVEQARVQVETDPKAAERLLREAEALAGQAQAIAEQEVASHRDDDSGTGSLGWGSGPRGRSSGVDVGSLILGGLLFGGGGGGGHSSAGTSWGGFGGGGGFSGGSFGGGGGFSGGFGGGSF